MNNIRNKLNGYMGVIKNSASEGYSLISSIVDNGSVSKTHFRYYVLNQKDLEQNVFEMDKERALEKLRKKPDGRNIRRAIRYDNDAGVYSAVMDNLIQRQIDLIDKYDAYSNAEHDFIYRANMSGTMGNIKSSNMSAREAAYFRKKADESIAERKKIERLMRSLDSSLDDYVILLAELYPDY